MRTDVRVLAEMQDGVKLLPSGFKSDLRASQFDQNKHDCGRKGEVKILNCGVLRISRAGPRGGRALLFPGRTTCIMDL